MSELLRVALVTGIYPPDIGGPATHAADLRAELTQRGHSVSVVTLCDGSSIQREPGMIRFPRRWPWPARLAAVAVWLIRNRDSFDRIYATGLQWPAVVAARLLRDRAVVVKVPGDDAWERSRRMGLTELDFEAFQATERMLPRVTAMRAVRNRWLRGADAITTPSQYLARTVEGWLRGPSDVRVVPNGVRLEGGEEAAAAPQDRDHAELKVIFAGRLVSHKRVERIIEAVASREGVSLDIVGSGPELPALRALVTALGCASKVSFVGDLSHGQLLEKLRTVDALVLASDYEGLPHVAIEALVCGTPVVAPAIGGVGEAIVDGKSGMVLDDAETETIASALTRLRDDPGLLQLLSVGAAEEGEGWRFEHTVDGVVDILADAGRCRPRAVFLGKAEISGSLGEEMWRRTEILVRYLRPVVIGVGHVGYRRQGLGRAFAFPDLRPRFLGGLLYYPIAPALAVALTAGRRKAAIVCHSPYEAAGAALWSLPLFGLAPRILVEVHGDWLTASRMYGSERRRLVSPIADRLASFGLRHADRVRAVTDYTESLAREAGWSGEIDRYVAFGDFSTFLESEQAPLPEVPQVAFVGVLETHKGADVLIRAWDQVARRIPAARLVMVGTGSRESQIEEMVQAQGLQGSVSLLGAVPHARVREVLDASTLMVLPSRSEGMGRVVLESFARSRPVVASAVGGIPELLDDGRTGLLVPPEEADALADALVALLADPRRAREMGLAARQMVVDLDPAADFESGIARLAEWLCGSPGDGR